MYICASNLIQTNNNNITMETKYKLKEGQTVYTKYGEAVIVLIDVENDCVRVKHTTANTPVTDFRITDLILK